MVQRARYPMIAAGGLLSFVVGAVAAYAADRFPAHVETIETGAGFLLISGLALSSYALPTVV
jgi:hypothetical protein